MIIHSLWPRPLLSQVGERSQIMKNQQRKKQRVVESDNQDYISQLHFSILSNILSSLKVKEAVKTSVLSSQWKHVYANPSNLVLDEENMLKIDYSATNDFKMNRTRAFVRNVKQYLSNVEEVRKIEELKVRFTFLNSEGYSDVDDWIRFAIKRNVEVIDLCLGEENHLSASNDGYVFPCDIVGNEGACASSFKSLKCLRLAHCVLAPHKHCNSGFSTLKTLELLKVDLKSMMHIKILLSSCNNLEWLGISECYNMECLKIVHHKLKYLSLNLCRQLKALVLHSTSLETLEYKGNKIELVFDAPRLKTFYSLVSDSIACHREVWPVFRLSIDLPQLETLMLECSCNMGEVMARRLPTFPRLRNLEIIKVAIKRQDLWWVAKTLKACPILERLELHLKTYSCSDEEIRKESWPPRCPHNFLKEVTITGIRGHSSEIEIAIYLLRNAISLERMTIDPRTKHYLGKGKWDLSETGGNWSIRENVLKHLKQEASSAVKLQIK
ncbi:hypothetical protein VNO77_04314 [Canavalia gladiata]|uniref:At1g61320/AtMIF1 LRR domain-containing protein n=1 Tax=Canavalia gladiata TaxID=3824 RepID=A0AAN9RD23_CANGL